MDKKDEPNIADQFAAWLETQEKAVCRAIAARAALRSLPAAMSVATHSTGRGITGAGLLLASLRAALISAVTCSLQRAGTENLNTVAETASAGAAKASADYSAPYAEARASAASARSAFNAVMTHFSDPQAACSKAVYAAANAAGRLSESPPARVEAYNAVYAECRNDAPKAGFEAFQTTLWQDETTVNSLLARWTKFQEYARDHPVWNFWLDWYRGFMEGKPLDWDLQRRVALIDDAIWGAGPEAVAAEIERIRAEFNAPPSDKERFPKHEPKSVRHLFENRVIAYASLQGLAAQVTHSIERFHAETGANALPEALEPLAALPALLLAVNSTIQDAPSDGVIASETEDQLRAEIGRLNAKVADLESKISGLEAVIAGLPTTERKGILHLLAQTALWGSLAGGLWMLSGEDADLRDRYENLIERKEQIRILLMQEGLPQTQVEKSLRPAARPGRA